MYLHCICLLNIPVEISDMVKNNDFISGKLKNMKHFSITFYQVLTPGVNDLNIKLNIVGLFRPCFFLCVESSFKL